VFASVVIEFSFLRLDGEPTCNGWSSMATSGKKVLMLSISCSFPNVRVGESCADEI
jgi:hypothetical protein